MWGPLGQLMSFNVISVDFKDNHFEFRVNQELTKSHMDFSVSSLDSSSRKKHGFRNRKLVCIFLDAE